MPSFFCAKRPGIRIITVLKLGTIAAHRHHQYFYFYYNFYLTIYYYYVNIKMSKGEENI